MFEETQKNQNLNSGLAGKPVSGLPPVRPGSSSAGQVEDIFAGAQNSAVPRPLAPPVFQSKDRVLSDDGVMLSEGRANNIKKFLILGVSAFVLIIAIFGGGWFVYGKFFSAANIPANENNQAPDSIEEETSNELPNDEFLYVDNIEEEKSDEFMENISNEIIEENPIGFSKKKDSDQDGLVDEDEIKLGTNINSPDSDGDGLFDREEVVVYKTDPLNPDTDGDGYLDGAEARAGYNPKGAGKLYEIK